MKKNIIIALVACVVMFIAYSLILSYYRKKITKKAFDLIKAQKGPQLDELLTKKSTSFFLKPFELYRLKLINAASKGNQNEIANRYAAFDTLRMNKAEKENIYSDAYFYFMSRQDSEHASKYYKLLEEIGDYKNKFNIECSYNTFIEHGYKYLDDALVRYNSSNDAQKISLASLISSMYANKGDKQNAIKYDEVAKKGVEKIKKNK
ncbi:MAG: hypothetical protein Q4E33_04915 [Erysipelotrichaceae bacterium]|nr:hypothetical protein [Erysipelotrichaceae bacterium]